MDLGDRAAHALIRAACSRERAAFLRGASQAAEVQRAILTALLKDNADTVFGREQGFVSIRGLAEYAKALPVRGYRDFLPYIKRIRDGREAILTREPVRLFEPTSGTGAATKFIPYTVGLRAQYGRAARAWLGDLYRFAPGIRSGRHWWSVSPSERARPDFPTSVPVGFDNDAAYLGGIGRILERTMAVPDSIKAAQDRDEFFDLMAYYLLRAGDLSLVSVWNPTYFLIAFGECLARAESACRRMQARSMAAGGGGLAARAHAVQTAIDAYAGHGDQARLLNQLWPRLALVSAWADAAAGAPARELMGLASKAIFQPKGLLATEGAVSIPMWVDPGGTSPYAAPAHLPAYRSHYLEFLPLGEEDGARARGLMELDKGQNYRVLISTAGGLYRYDLEDIVNVQGRVLGLPALRFRGRAEGTDLVGEKLSEAFCHELLDKVFGPAGRPELAFLAPRGDGRLGYVMYAGPFPGQAPPPGIAQRAESLLSENYHYRHARRLGQLEPLRLYALAVGARGERMRAAAREGRNPGGLKPVALDKRADWDSILPGGYMDA
jgi:hypothetical protein